jgi:hypothetical protein
MCNVEAVTINVMREFRRVFNNESINLCLIMQQNALVNELNAKHSFSGDFLAHDQRPSPSRVPSSINIIDDVIPENKISFLGNFITPPHEHPTFRITTVVFALR